MSFTCDICFNDFNEGNRCPRILSCGHTFCHGCIQKLIEEKSTCPKCSGKIEYEEAIKALVNFFVLQCVTKSEMSESQDESQEGASGSFVVELKKSSSEASLPYEGHCLDHTLPNHFMCMKCNVLICGTCAMLSHMECKPVKVSEALDRTKTSNLSKLKKLMAFYSKKRSKNEEDLIEMKDSLKKLQEKIEKKTVEINEEESILERLSKLLKETEGSNQILEILKAEAKMKLIPNWMFDLIKSEKGFCKVNPMAFLKKVSK